VECTVCGAAISTPLQDVEQVNAALGVPEYPTNKQPF
jgi:hypothetical protein